MRKYSQLDLYTLLGVQRVYERRLESFAPYLIKVLEIEAKLQLRNFRILLDFYKI